jgi:hypothetical protein
VREADHGGLGDGVVQDQGALDLGGAHPVARDVDDVVDPAGDPVIAVLVPAAAVAGEILARIGGEIGLEEAFVSPQTPRIWPGQLSVMTRLPLSAPSSTLPSASTSSSSTPGRGWSPSRA